MVQAVKKQTAEEALAAYRARAYAARGGLRNGLSAMSGRREESAPTSAAPTQPQSLTSRLINAGSKQAQAKVLVDTANTKPWELKTLRHLDLSGVDLRGMPGAEKLPFSKLNLDRANLDGLNLNGADLRHANLAGASLANANLSNAKCEGANMQGANFGGAQLGGANFNNARLDQANFDNTAIVGASFNKASLAGARMANTTLDNCSLVEANMSGVQGAGLNILGGIHTGLNLQDAQLQGATLNGTFNEVSLSGNLKDAKLAGATFINSSVSGTNVAQSQPQVSNSQSIILSALDATPTAAAPQRPSAAFNKPWAGMIPHATPMAPSPL